MSTSPEVEQALKERFLALPKVVQDAMLSADVETHLRGLSGKYKLHLDQWQKLEDEVMFTLLGIKSADQLLSTIETTLGMSETEALALTTDISHTIFEPIREQMERELGSPDAHAENMTRIEQVRTEMLGQEKVTLLAEHNIENPAPPNTTATPPKPFVATPPPPKPETQSIRTEVPPESHTGTSSERKAIANDLYREQL